MNDLSLESTLKSDSTESMVIDFDTENDLSFHLIIGFIICEIRKIPEQYSHKLYFSGPSV